jgi:hypothetical protein
LVGCASAQLEIFSCRAAVIFLKNIFVVESPMRHPSHIFLPDSLNRSGLVRMPTYTFKLRSDAGGLADNTGAALADKASAYRYACSVARELMRCREIETRHWLLEVYQDGQGPLFDILFASIDPTLDHLRRELRTVVESASGNKRAFKDAVHAIGLTLRESRALLARSEGRPHLICDNGEVIIRNFV